MFYCKYIYYLLFSVICNSFIKMYNLVSEFSNCWHSQCWKLKFSNTAFKTFISHIFILQNLTVEQLVVEMLVLQCVLAGAVCDADLASQHQLSDWGNMPRHPQRPMVSQSVSVWPCSVYCGCTLNCCCAT